MNLRRVCFPCLSLLVLMPGASPAEINVAPSVEWLSCSADVIVVGKIGKIASVAGPGAVTYEDCTVDVARIIKGKVEGKQITFTLRRVGDAPTAQPALKEKADVLLFLSKSKDHGSERHLDDKWVPLALPGAPPIVSLAGPFDDLYTREMKAIDNQGELLMIVAKWADSPIRHSIHVEVPFDATIHRKLWAGSSVLLIVPAEEKFRAELLKRALSPNSHERARAAGDLYKFPGQDTEKVLRHLLADDSTSLWQFSQDHITKVAFHVRSAAFHSLQALKLPVREVILEREPTAEEQRNLRISVWTKSFDTALKGGWKVTITDGPSRMLDGRKEFIVHVTCRRDKETVTFQLVPKEWPSDDLPRSRFLGINGPSSQGARRFHVEGPIPNDTLRQVVGYFGLE